MTNISPICFLIANLITPRGIVVTLGHRDALQSWRHRDADTIENSTQGAGLVLTSTHCTAGEGWSVPQADTARLKQSGMGGR